LALVRADDDSTEIYDPDVHVLTNDNFQAFISSNEYVLVEFYAPWCGHCKRLAPEYAKAATTLKQRESPVKLAKVDATVHGEAAKQFDVKGYPTLKFFRNGEASEYGGGRTESEIVSWLTKKSSPVSKELASQEELDSFTSSRASTRIVAYLQPVDVQTWLKVAGSDKFDGLTFGHVKDSSFFGDRVQGTVEVYKDGNVITDSAANEKLLELIHKTRIQQRPRVFSEHWLGWLLDNSFPLVDTYSEQVVTRAESKKRDLLVIVAPDVVASAAAASVAAARKDKLVVATTTDVDAAKNWGISGDVKPSAILTINSKKNSQQWIWNEETEGALNAESLAAFVDASTQGTYSSYLKSEPVPENNGPVTVLVGKTIQEAITNNKDVFVKFYAPWCGHCKTLAPIWEELGEAFADDDNVVIAKLDATANKLPPTLAVKSYPTLILFTAKGKQVSYNGERDLPSLKSWVDSKKAKKVKKEDRDEL